jgi:hypothetical protein
MFRHPVYLAFGALVLAVTVLAEMGGWTLTSATEIKNVPRSVRDNPGAYRSIYRSVPHYTGGK